MWLVSKLKKVKQFKGFSKICHGKNHHWTLFSTCLVILAVKDLSLLRWYPNWDCWKDQLLVIIYAYGKLSLRFFLEGRFLTVESIWTSGNWWEQGSGLWKRLRLDAWDKVAKKSHRKMKVVLLYRTNIINYQLIYSTNTSRVPIDCYALFSVWKPVTVKTDRFFTFWNVHLSGER